MPSVKVRWFGANFKLDDRPSYGISAGDVMGSPQYENDNPSANLCAQVFGKVVAAVRAGEETIALTVNGQKIIEDPSPAARQASANVIVDTAVTSLKLSTARKSMPKKTKVSEKEKKQPRTKSAEMKKTARPKNSLKKGARRQK
jgi:hypothetical protein